MLSDLLSPNFSLDVRGGGEAYFRCRAVHIDTYEREGGEDFIEATVQDGQKHQVKMVIGGDRAELLVEALCSCRYEVKGLCKHVWATVRTLESKYHIPAARSAVMETLELVDESEEFDGFESDLPPIIPLRNGGRATPQELVRLLQESVEGPSDRRGGSQPRARTP